ncbi:abc-type multidrug transport system, permease component [hydrocarbon metagenome]|uniref:Abc-type multidrug transport system, permease component n=1 Tax=hydrocarbon metagenome TaxID=938273 RepID=A0A0W8FXC3_9ZZZZ
MISANRIKAVAKKEIKQISRDKRFLGILLLLPVMLLVLFGYAVNFDVKNIKLAVQDMDKSYESRQFINSLTSSEYFTLVEYIHENEKTTSALDEKRTQVVMVIPSDFSNKLHRAKEETHVQFLIDGVDGNSATIIKNYVEAATLKYNSDFQKEMFAKLGIKQTIPIDLQPVFWFNPELRTTVFLIPGLIAMILIITSVVSVSLSLVREKERGTIEQINVSSLNTLEVMLGKVLPYVVIALIDAVFILIAGYILFDVVVKGDYALMFLSTLIFIISGTSLGIFISSVADSQQVAFTAATFASMLPSLILSGFIFPIESMPVVIQWLTNITPAKFYLTSLRAIMLRGVGLEAFWEQWIYLGVFTFLLLLLGNIISKRKEAKN